MAHRLLLRKPMLLKKLNKLLFKRMQVANAPVIMFGILGLINYPVFYLVWHHLKLQHYNSLVLRLIATILCFGLVIKNYWPQNLKKYLPTYWYLTVTYCLPFFGSYLFLLNKASTMWLTNGMLVLFWLILSIDWISFVIVLPIGTFLGWLFYMITTNDTSSINLSSNIIVSTFSNYLWAIVIAAMMTQNREKLNQARFQGMKLDGASIAHELRTPLVTIHIGIEKIKELIPKYTEAYIIAKKNHLPIPFIPKKDHNLFLEIADDISSEARFSDIVISMLLMQLSHKIDRSNFIQCSINYCITEAIRRYPFQENERQLINLDLKHKFNFTGQDLLIIHVLFNLIKNALYSINKSLKGNIYISTSSNNKFNILQFKDTGEGIPKKIQTRVFNQYFTTSTHGKGIGLAFCELVMDNLGGEITVDSVENSYTIFNLYFPKIR